MLNVNVKKCTGCGACVQRCPQKCIAWAKGEFDFLYPAINTMQCINCGLCEKVCPIEKGNKTHLQQKAYAAVHTESEVLASSTSGGAFTAIADSIFGMEGIVYGVTMDANMQVKHIRIEKREDMAQLRSSKYLQSDTGNTYRQAESDLKEGKTVLYSGTPCQIDGLKNYLQRSYDKLYIVDIVCHGVGSQGYFNKYMEFARARYGKIKTLRFRSKEFSGWSCGGVVVVDDVNHTKEKKIPYRDFDNYYYSYFLSGDIYRKCCYTCKYANTNRIGDFSLGDYWGVEALNLPLDTRNGCSLLLVNNERAKELLDGIKALDKVETTVEQAAHCNKQLNTPSALPPKRETRISEYENLTGEQIQKEYLKTHKKYVLKGKVKASVPYCLKLFIRSRRR